MIRVHGLSKSYGKSRVVKSISFDLNPGDYVAIVGPSGSGKTTLLSMMAGLIRPSEGDVFFHNQQLNKLSPAAFARFRSENIGLIFQFSELVPNLNVRDNILLPGLFAQKLSKFEYEARADFIMERLALTELEKARPMDLSGGQTQLVAIARSLINEPKVLLADEPSGDLDPGHSKMVKSLFAEYNKAGLAILLVTHDMKLAFDAKTVYEMVDGEFTDIVTKGRRR